MPPFASTRNRITLELRGGLLNSMALGFLVGMAAYHGVRRIWVDSRQGRARFPIVWSIPACFAAVQKRCKMYGNEEVYDGKCEQTYGAIEPAFD